MADPREVVPPPGTDPLVSKQDLRRFREDAAIYARHREDGTHPYTLDEVDARIRACAADLAAGGGEGLVGPPILPELVTIFWHRLFRDVPIGARQRAQFDLEVNKAETNARIASENVTRAERRRRNLESERKLARPPVTGTFLSQPWTILLCLIPGAVIEVLGGAPSLRIAFGISPVLAAVFATAISAILILAADQLGNALASSSRTSRRLAAILALGLVGIAVGSAVWTVAELAASRTVNLEREAELEAIESSGGKEAGFTGFGERFGTEEARQAGEEEAEKTRTEEAKRKQQEIEELPAPSFVFFVPLSILIISTATLIAFRIEAALDWNAHSAAIEDARAFEAEQRARGNDASREADGARLPEEEVFHEAAAYVEREHGLLTAWIERFRGEYRRFCDVEGVQPRSMPEPVVPTTDEALARLLYPRHWQAGVAVPGPSPSAPSNDRGGLNESDRVVPQADDPHRRRPRRARADAPDSSRELSTGPTDRPPRQQPPPRRRPGRRDRHGRATGWGLYPQGDE